MSTENGGWSGTGSSGELTPEQMRQAQGRGLTPEAAISEKHVEEQRRRTDEALQSCAVTRPHISSHVSQGPAPPSPPLLPRLVRATKICLLTVIAVLGALFAFDSTRPLTYFALSGVTQPTIFPGSELAHIKQVVPGTTNHGPKDGHLKALRGAPVEWERMNAKQKTALASVHAIFVSSSFYPDLTISEGQWKYLKKAIPSYLSAYAKTDPIYSQLLSEFYLKDIGGRNHEAALSALAHGSSDAMPFGRGRISNWFAHKALAGQIANRARTQDARDTSR